MDATRSPIALHPDAALLVLRIGLGTVFIAHGAQKVFEMGLEGVQDGFAGMGVPLASVVGPLVALVELLGGVAVLLGLMTRLSAAGIGTVMVGAILLVHLPAGFFLPNGIEFTWALLTLAVALVLAGPGRFSLDALLSHGRPIAVRAVPLDRYRRHREEGRSRAA